MDQPLKYEKLIAGKLESIPVPDMEDAIWARIKTQLDIDMPTDDHDGQGPSGPSGPGIIGWGLSILLAALVTTFFLLNNKKPGVKELQDNTSNRINTNQSVQQNSNAPPFISNKPTRSQNTTTIDSSTGNVVSIDSVSGENVAFTPSAAIDSNTIKQPDVVAVNNISKGDTVPASQKKPRGVPVSEDDYKIIPNKKNN